MTPSQPEPHDEAPELFPSDVWEDAGQLAKDTQGSGTILPPRRPPPETVDSASAAQDHGGLRIGTNSSFREVDPDEDRFEVWEGDSDEDQFVVREIDGSVVRLEPEAPSQPKMPRHEVFHEQAPQEPREGESATWGIAKKFSVKWIAGISVGIAALVIISISLLPLINRSNAASSRVEPSTPVMEPEEAPSSEPGPYDELINRTDEAMRIFKKFATAPHEENFLPMTRDCSAVEPLVRSSRRPVVVSRHWSPENDARWEVHQNEGLPYALLNGKMPDYSEFNAYFVLADQRLLLDWKATTAFSTATFEELKRNQGDPAEIRGSLTPSGHYSPIFPETNYRSYLLESPDTMTMIWCYTRRSEPVDEQIQALFVGGGILKPSSKPQKVTLRLEHAPEDALPNQWLIGELLHKDWISP